MSEDPRLRNGTIPLMMDDPPPDVVSSSSTPRMKISSPQTVVQQRLLKRLQPTLEVLQLFGYFPCSLNVLKEHHGEQKSYFYITGKVLITVVLILYTIGTIAINIGIFGFNIYTSYSMIKELGLLHAMTTSIIITGIKPAVNCFQQLIFALKFNQHRQLLIDLQQLDDLFYDLTGKRAPNVAWLNRAVGLTVFLLFGFAFSLRVFDIGYKQEPFFSSIINMVSLFLVPLLTVWSIIPLLYYLVLTRLICYWCKMLRKTIRKDFRLRDRSLADYFYYFKRLTATMTNLGPVFNLFITFSLTWSLITVCLAIYFVTQAKVLIEVPPGLNNPIELRMFLLIVYFNMGWSLVQIIVAFMFITCVSAAGFRTNEEAVEILDEILSVDPGDESKCDSTTINCFAYQMSCLRCWGISVMRAFPIQRSTLLTMVSLILTYCMILFKMRSDQTFTSHENQPPYNGTDFI